MPAQLSRLESTLHTLRHTHRGLDGVVPGDVLQRKGVRVLSRFSQKVEELRERYVAKSAYKSAYTGNRESLKL
jgi:hypothetical protein